jgi:hypothetical protein
LYETDPSFGALPVLDTVGNDAVRDTLLERQRFQELLKQNLAEAQNKMKVNANAKRSPCTFQLGDLIWLKLQHYAQSSVVNRPCPKLTMKFFGPYKILNRIGAVAYILELPANSQVQPVFHVSQLKPYTTDYTPKFTPLCDPPQLDLHDLEPELILDRRLSKKGNAAITQVLVKWTRLPTEMATWEDFHMLKS